MANKSQGGLRMGMQTSPWIILGSTAILLIVVMVLAYQNTNRERRYMTQLLSAKGAALIRAVEAGARTGMMGMMWGSQQIQRLLEETARLPDVVYMAVIDRQGQTVAHSDFTKINTLFDPDRNVTHLGPNEHENWELVTLDNQRRVFEVHRHFRPLNPDGKNTLDHNQSMIDQNSSKPEPSNDWLSPQNRQQLLIIVGLDVTPFQEAVRNDIQTTILLSVVMLLLGFGGFVSLFWMHNYRAARRSLQDTSAFANEVVSHLPVGLIATDRLKRITFFNAAAEKITGLKRATVQNQKPDKFLPEGLSDVQKSLDQGATITEQEMECTFAGDRTVPVSVSGASITNDLGDFIGQILILRNLEEIRRLQAEIRRQEKLAALGGLAAGVAHEIRNPLSSIKGMASFFAGQFAEGSEAREAAKVMVQEVDRLNRVITELLEFARPSDLKMQLTRLPSLLSRSIRLIQQDAAKNSVEIKLQAEDNIDPAWIDPDRLAQCLLNLYLNAIQAMENGGILTVQCAADTAETVRIIVSDTGRGIASDHLNQIFDPYFTTKKKGTGLGLAIVYKIIEAHQGHIDVKSTPGQGASFTITIPCRPSDPQRGNHDIA
ncbi:MAG: ATP-binding protein [Desulfobacterales bacterium]|nr:ATP-binding protein [Desulfobacterales bacterium]